MENVHLIFIKLIEFLSINVSGISIFWALVWLCVFVLFLRLL